MILVMLGTNPYPFLRLLYAVDKWAGEHDEEVVVQAGHTGCNTDNIKCHDFVPHRQIEQWISEARIVVTQGGFGSIRDSLAAKKPTIAVPRMREFGECQDDQAELVDALAQEGKVIALYEVEMLDHAINGASDFVVPDAMASRIPEIVREAVCSALKVTGRG
ncbi:glycosyltransferase [Thiogranum longum]|uniref:glycosyltransferase n=1 Tax=Thiogranum longum TaxID=1537524 RepID=UPI0014030BE1|nr:glycosyltransferase [Thiogranum longum]